MRIEHKFHNQDPILRHQKQTELHRKCLYQLQQAFCTTGAARKPLPKAG